MKQIQLKELLLDIIIQVKVFVENKLQKVIFNAEKIEPDDFEAFHETVRTKLSMMLDFLFQAKLWCDQLTKLINKEEK